MYIKPHEYGDVILPLTVLKRFDSVLSDTKSKVLEASKKYDEKFAQRDFILKETSGQNFYNTSKYDFKKLLDDPANIEENFYNYLDGYSKEVTDIVENFDLKDIFKKWLTTIFYIQSLKRLIKRMQIYIQMKFLI